LTTLVFRGQPVFALSLYLHGMTLVFLGMFVASSAGEVLFNKQEADILLHRPVTPKAMLWAKVTVLVQISLWLAIAFNLVGMIIGIKTSNGGWLFPAAHLLSTALQALFCTGFIVVTYQLCLRWFGRERLEGLMTTVQIVMAIAVVLGGQIVPQLLRRFGTTMHFNVGSWWVALLPPAWFAGIDDALAGDGMRGSWILAGFGATITTAVLWLAFEKLARSYETGLQVLGETSSVRAERRRARWLARVVNAAPLRWWLRNSVARGAFLLVGAYLFRDRETKLRIYPGIAPMMVMPFIFLLQGRAVGNYAAAFSGTYLGLVPMLGLTMLRYSQQWQASDLFRLAPVDGPAAFCHGARRAVLFFLGFPALMVFGVILWLIHKNSASLLLLLPGMIALPIYALIPCLGGKAVPLSLPTEEAKPAGQGVRMMIVTFVSLPLAGIATWAWSNGWFWWLILIESVIAAGLYVGLRSQISRVRWDLME
jgi:hypothetical protein